MVTRTLRLNAVDKVQKFVRIVCSYEFDVDLGGGRTVIDAKSIMGILSLDLSKDVTLTIYADDDKSCAELLEKLEEFVSN